jgi:hypothetical protein
MPALSPHKAGKMLKHGSVRGKPLSKKQKGLFGLIKGGKKPTRLSESKEAVKKAIS